VGSKNNTDSSSRSGGASTSATPSIALLNRRLGISPTPRMLTPFEIHLLRRCAQEAMDVAHEVFANGETDSPS